MDVSDVFVVLLVSHLAGDFLLQTEFQALNKRGGLRRGNARGRRALLSHLLTYAAVFVPALVWIAIETHALRAGAVAVIVFGTHVVQDDGRLIAAWTRRVKRVDPEPGTTLAILIDQSAHLVALFAAALVATV